MQSNAVKNQSQVKVKSKSVKRTPNLSPLSVASLNFSVITKRQCSAL